MSLCQVCDFYHFLKIHRFWFKKKVEGHDVTKTTMSQNWSTDFFQLGQRNLRCVCHRQQQQKNARMRRVGSEI